MLVEVEGIVNSRPLVVETINNVNSQAAVSPRPALTMKLKVVMPPRGVFGTCNLYCRKRWRQVQHISNKFWIRWRKEYLFMGGKPIPEYSMVNWLFDMMVESFGSSETMRYVECLLFVDNFVQIWYWYIDCTHMSCCQGCMPGLILVGYLHFCSLGLLGFLLAFFCSFIKLGLSCFSELF